MESFLTVCDETEADLRKAFDWQEADHFDESDFEEELNLDSSNLGIADSEFLEINDSSCSDRKSMDDDFSFMLYGGVPSEKNRTEPLKRGRKRLEDKNPAIVLKASRFVSQHGAAAHVRRRSETSYCGVRVRDVQRCILEEAGQKVSRDYVHKLFKAPRSNCGTAKRYKGVIDARLAAKRNDLHYNLHSDIHFAAAQVSYAAEFTALHPEETLLLSCDDKNKLTLGLPPVHRLNHDRKFYPKKDQPNFMDHDFPVGAKKKLTPEGIMILMNKRGRPTVQPFFL